MKIEINIGKRHFWTLVGVIVLLFGVTMVIAKTTTPAYTDDQPFHETLYADVIAGKTTTKVTVDDNMAVTGNLDVKGNITASNITADNITVVGNVVAGNVVIENELTLGGVARDKWPDEEYRCYGQGGAAIEDLMGGGEYGDCWNSAYYSCTRVSNCGVDDASIVITVIRGNYYDVCGWACKYTG